jgi:Ca2+-binding RTX toxin-like protein
VELLADDGSGNVPKFIADLGGGLDVDPDGITYLNGRLIFAGKQMPTNTTNSVSDLLYYVDLASITPPTPPVTPPQTPSNQLSSMSFSKGTLSITGTSGDDQIILSRLPSDPSKLKVSFNGKTSVYKLSDVSQIVIHGGDGNDTIAFNEKSGKIAIASKIYGDAGNDNITGGSGVDRIYGGDGNDWIEGGGGNDVIYGEAGNDRLFGGAGRDHIDGGAGVNVLRGEDGVDSLFANAGDDLRGNKGDVLDQLQA